MEEEEDDVRMCVADGRSVCCSVLQHIAQCVAGVREDDRMEEE